MLPCSYRRPVEEEEEGQDKSQAGYGRQIVIHISGNLSKFALHRNGNTSHIATSLLKSYRQIWLWKRECRRRTNPHTACIEGRLGIKFLGAACVLCVKQTCNPHFAVPRCQFETLWRLQGSNCCPQTVNTSDCSSDTALHLVASGKQFSTMRDPLTHTSNSIVEEKATNNSSFTALEILDELPQQGKINTEKEKHHERNGASRAKDNMIEAKNNLRDGQYILLLVATMMAITSFESVRNPPAAVGYEFKSSLTSNLPQTEKQLPNLFRLFIVCNFINFFSSITLITNLTREFPLKPCRLLSLSFFTGAYLRSLLAVSPYVTKTLLLPGGFILLVASMGCLAWHCITWHSNICRRHIHDENGKEFAARECM